MSGSIGTGVGCQTIPLALVGRRQVAPHATHEPDLSPSRMLQGEYGSPFANSVCVLPLAQHTCAVAGGGRSTCARKRKSWDKFILVEKYEPILPCELLAHRIKNLPKSDQEIS